MTDSENPIGFNISSGCGRKITDSENPAGLNKVISDKYIGIVESDY